MQTAPGAPRIWVDVEDLFQYAAANTRPSGIQRVVFELCRALHAHPDAAGRVGFLRHDPLKDGFVSIPFALVDALHQRLTDGPAHAEPTGSMTETGSRDDGAGRPGLLRRLAYRLPLEVRAPAVALVKAQRDSVRAALRLAGAAATEGGRRLRTAASRLGAALHRRRDAGALAIQSAASPACFATDAAPGDVLLVLGSPWFHPFYAAMLGRACVRHGLRSAAMFYDVIPLIRPEWCQRNLVHRFRHWVETLLPLVDVPLTISQATGRDLQRFAAREAVRLRSAPTAIPMGTGFFRPDALAAPIAPAAPKRLPPPGSFVLIVSTLEARKNHALLFRVWRRLLDEMPEDQVPTLVFAGRVGWLVEDLVRQLHNTDGLGGKIMLLPDPDDGELEQLYRGCRFTVFPSFYEGWGLPVTESLGFGRPCIASDSSALPEAGGALVRYFDPEDGNAAYREIRRAIEDRDGTEAWAAQVQREFQPVGWDESVRVLLRALG